MVIELPGDARRKIVATLNADHTELFHCLQIRVSNLQSWTETDILANLDGGNFLTDPPAEMARIEGGLSRRRIHNLDTKNKDLVSARSYLQQFNKIFMKQSSGPVSVTDPREFVAFYNVHRCYCEDAASIRANTSSSLKASSFTVYFIHPPFFYERKSSAQFEYKEQMPWKFPIFLSTHTSPDSWCKFTPNNDFSASSPTHLCPFVISEVVSQTTEQARYQMLVEAIAALRVGHYLLKSGSDKQFFIVAIYFRENMTAERFIVTHTGQGREVSIAQRDFDLTTADDATAFFREMYNLATELEDLGKALDDRKEESLQKLRDAASKLPSLTSEARGQKTTTARTTLASDRDEWKLQDDLGVFEAGDIKALLKKMNYKIDFIPFGHPRLAVISHKADDSKSEYLKYVEERRKNEVEIQQHLAQIKSPSNHTIAGAQVWPVLGGTVISTPVAGGWLTSLKNPDSNLWSVAQQLFEAVDFMHEHGVAHLDLKPQNIIIPPLGGWLSIIDFNTSVRINGPDDTFCGAVGTDGYMPPEVEAGMGRYSALRADLWSCGKTLEELCLLCRPSEERQLLLEIADRLLSETPSARPTMANVLELMSSRKG
ncbi:hypothetical protein BJ138DRAFT_1151693 [Hygrophoropsis aurantiaca]|uniref:Uncharacterized protein n=1 Tax=Hygrophoropsis aurantiaca TaxID=72124 RepID=A0ACB8ACG0_9AGAM|nr:hypothetical protein BJ138DRAFT_1151693 [Hygrophoropsis aurantiaca]